MAGDVTVYSTPLCAPCERLKQYLRAHEIEFVSKDLMMDQEAAEKIDELGIRSSPVLEVDGAFYSGPQLTPELLAKVLDIG